MSMLSNLFCKPTVPPPLAKIIVVKDGSTVVVATTGSTGAIIHNRIGFGDMEVAWDNKYPVRHTYSAPGDYYVSVVVVDKWGRVSENGQIVTIP